MDSVPSAPPPLPVAYEDRKAGLVIFGILTLLFGAFCLLSVPLTFVGVTLAKNDPNISAFGNPLPGMIFYLILAAILISLGIGSIMARRWARALLAVLSWSALLVGLTSTIMLATMSSGLTERTRAAHPANQPPLPQQVETIVVAIMVMTIGVFYILLPLVWALFYSGKNVGATCEVRDPKARWTDHCPLPVLGAVTWMAFGAVTMLMLPMVRPVFPAFGLLLTGPVATILYLILGFVWGYSAWSLYRLRSVGWWLLMITLIILQAVAELINGPSPNPTVEPQP